MATTFKALLERRITVDATPSVVWGIVRDIRRMPEWSPQVVSVKMRRRQDVVTDGEDAAAVTANAPVSEDNFFLVPKVVE